MTNSFIARCRDLAAQKARPETWDETLAELRRYNDSLFPSEARNAYLNGLDCSQPRCVVSGQQVGLFGGPLFTIYKALSTCVLAEQLSAALECPVAPVFWLQTEDHDIAEIKSVELPAAEGGLTEVTLPVGLEEQRLPVGDILLGEPAIAAIDDFALRLGSLPGAPMLIEKLRASYRPHTSWGQAFAEFFSWLFADFGLVFFEPRQMGLSHLARTLYGRAIDDAHGLSEALFEHSERLRTSGRPTPVKVPLLSPPWFYHSLSNDGRELGRTRFFFRDEHLHIGEPASSLSPRSMRELFNEDPNRFSSTALFRPVLQDYVLPTLSFIGGDTEIDYLAQCAPLYSRLGVSQGVPLYRPHLTLVDKKTSKWLESLGLSHGDALLSREEIRRQAASFLASSRTTPETLLSESSETFDSLFSRLESCLTDTEETLRQPVRKTREKVQSLTSSLLERYREALIRKDGLTEERLTRIESTLRPQGEPQERRLSAAWALSRYGTKDLLSSLLPYCIPGEKSYFQTVLIDG